MSVRKNVNRRWAKINGRISRVPCYIFQRTGRRCSSCEIGSAHTRADRRGRGEFVPYVKNGPRNGKPPTIKGEVDNGKVH